MKVTKCDCCGKMAEKAKVLAFRVSESDVKSDVGEAFSSSDICNSCLARVLKILAPSKRKKVQGKKRGPKPKVKQEPKPEVAAPKKRGPKPKAAGAKKGPKAKKGRVPVHKSEATQEVLPGQTTLPTFDASKMPAMPKRPGE